MIWAVLCAALAWAQPDTPAATLVYYNARLALAEGKPDEATRLWLLRNAVADRTGKVSAYDDDFRSIAWASFGELGLCQDGFAHDDAGAGLWPLARFNWAIRNLNRRAAPKRKRTFDAFQVERQQRVVTAYDVLDAAELGSLSLVRAPCFQTQIELWTSGESLKARLSDREVAGRFLLRMLERAEETLSEEGVRGRSVIAARRFDLYLQLVNLSRRSALKDVRAVAAKGRTLGLPSRDVAAIREEAAATNLDPESDAGRVLQDCLGWPVEEWMALSADRRRFVFEQARLFGGEPEVLDGIALGVIDALAARGEGAEVEAWIGLRLADEATSPERVWRGERGLRLLALDAKQGFGERGVLALHRGVDHLAQGDLPEALRSFAFALRHAPESNASEDVAGLARRWMSYVAGQFTLTEELIVTLQALLPPRDYTALLEDLLWRSALHVDGRSFKQGQESLNSRGAVDRRVAMLAPLAEGDAGQFASRIRAGLAESPNETLRFVKQFLEHLALEDADVRERQRATLELVERVLAAYRAKNESQARRVDPLLTECAAMRQGLPVASPWGATLDRARGLGPDSVVFAGSVRLAPADVLPWPFRAGETAPPSAFTPILLRPRTYTGPDGARVLGWSIEG